MLHFLFVNHQKQATQREQVHQQYPSTCKHHDLYHAVQNKHFISYLTYYLPHILVPGHIWEPIIIRFALVIFSLLDITWFHCRVFTDKSGVQQNDIRAKDGLDHLQDTGVFGQVPHPGVLKMNIVEAVLSVLCACRMYIHRYDSLIGKKDSAAKNTVSSKSAS